MLVLGDFNFQYDCDHKMSHMRDILTQFDLEQCVRDPTHKSGHVIDWVLQRQSDPLLHSVSVQSVLTSKHASIVCIMKVSKLKCPPIVMFRRKLMAIGTDAFHTDLSQILTDHADMTVTELKHTLHHLLTSMLQSQSTLRKERITPWFTPEILVAKRESHRAERAWRKSGLTVHKEIFTQKKDAVTRLVLKTKTDYLNAQVAESQTRKQLFSVTNSLLG